MMQLARTLTAAGLLALAAAQLASASGPTVHLTASGDSAARASLLTAAVMGKGWTADSPESAPIVFACASDDPSGAGVVEIGAAAQPDLSGGSTGPNVTEATAVYATAAQASTLWRRTATAKLLGCARDGLSLITNKGIRVHVLSQKTFTPPDAPPRTAGYRVVADLVSKTQTVKTYFDVILVSRGRAISELTVDTFLDPVTPAAAEGALATLVYSKLH